MNKNSVHYFFHPTSPGSIIRKHEKGEHISWEDVRRVLESNAEAINDPVIRVYADRAERGELPKRAGRPRKRLGHYVRLFVARDLIEEKIAVWRKARAHGSSDAPARGRGEPGLFERACDEVVREMRLAMCGRALANALSRAKKTHPLLFGE